MIKPIHHAIIWAILGLLATFRSSAQQISFRQSELDLAGPKHKLLLCPGGDFLAITHHFPDDKGPLTLTRFDPQTLAVKYTYDIKEFALQHYQAAFYADDRLFVLSSTKEGAVSRYEVNDKNGALIGSSQSLFNLEIKNEHDADFSAGGSLENTAHFLIAQAYEKKRGTIFQGALFDRQMNRTGSFSYTVPGEQEDFEDVEVVQAGNGTLNLVYSTKVRTSKEDFRPASFTLIQVDPRGKLTTTALTGLPAGELRNFTWLAKGGRLEFTVFSRKQKKDDGLTAFISGSYDTEQKKYGDFRETAVTSLLRQDPSVVKDLKEMKKDGLRTDCKIKKAYLMPDGSKTLVLEGNSDFSKTFGTAGPAGSASAGAITYQQRGNLYVMKLDKANVPQWLTLIPRWQEEADFALSVGTACLMDDNGNTHLFFYDDKDCTEPTSSRRTWIYMKDHRSLRLACVSVTPEGKMTKQLFEQQDRDYRLMYEGAVARSGNSFFMLAIKPKKAMFPEKFFNHSTFRLTEVTLGPPGAVAKNATTGK